MSRHSSCAQTSFQCFSFMSFLYSCMALRYLVWASIALACESAFFAASALVSAGVHISVPFVPSNNRWVTFVAEEKGTVILEFSSHSGCSQSKQRFKATKCGFPDNMLKISSSHSSALCCGVLEGFTSAQRLWTDFLSSSKLGCPTDPTCQGTCNTHESNANKK